MSVEASVKKKRWKGKPSGGWITSRKITQYLALVIFIILFIGSRRGGFRLSLVSFPMRLDPLVMLAQWIASRVFLAGAALALITVGLSLIFGRAWCGWLCPLGTVLDLFTPNRWRRNSAQRPAPAESWRRGKYVILLTILAAAVLGNLTLLVLDPLTIFFRTLSASLWPALDQTFTLAESALYRIPFLAGPVSTLDQWVRPKIFPTEPVFYRDTLLFAGIFVGLLLLNWIAPRFWCRYLCPLGGLLGLFSKLAFVRREVGESCKGCTLCTQSCPTGTIDPSRGYISDPSECTLCLDCLEVCPRSSIVFTPRVSLAAWNTYDPGRRDALLAVGGAIFGVALFQSSTTNKEAAVHLLRPPGAEEETLLAKCIRCAECVRACPTTGLQPAITEAGVEGLWTPVLMPRLGYCDYACNACGQICPVQAIPPLSLDDKRVAVIGKAYIDQNRCIAWSDHKDCIVCEEMCPLPDKAVHLEESEVTLPGGESKKILLPSVLRERCIGCGICEYKCPVRGEAAIRVYVQTPEVAF